MFPLVHKIIKKKQQEIFNFSQFEFALSLHYPFNNSFRPSFLAWQTADGGNHLVMGFPFVTQILSSGVLNIVLLRNLIQSIDTRIPVH